MSTSTRSTPGALMRPASQRRGLPAWIELLLVLLAGIAPGLLLIVTNNGFVAGVIVAVAGGVLGLLLYLLFRMTSNALVRDVAGTLWLLLMLLGGTLAFILAEKFLEQFKSH